MAIEAARARRRAKTPTVPEQITIGQEEPEIFTCPVCSRPLARGVRRCPGCSTRLIAGMPLTLASGFVAAGLVVGLLVGGSSVAGISALTAAHPTAAITTAQAVVPSAVPGPSTGSTGSGTRNGGGTTNPAISALAGSSLQQAGAVNVKLAEGSAALREALAQRDFDPAAAADILRSIAASASFGSDLAPNIGGWDAASGLSIELAEFYGSVRVTARAGLESSITSASAYRQAARDMLRALAPLPGLDTEARALALAANIDLPLLPSATP